MYVKLPLSSLSAPVFSWYERQKIKLISFGFNYLFRSIQNNFF